MTQPQNILIVGATSAIAEATARQLAARGAALFLTGRRPDRLAAITDDLCNRGATRAAWALLDVDDLTRHAEVLDAAATALGTIDVVLVAHGTLPDQQACEASVEQTLAAFGTNAVATIALLTAVANRLAVQGHGTIAVIGSVAGDRGRQSNYVYGSAKGAVDIFAQGLRNRLTRSGVHVLLVKPGFVDTPMTATFRKGVLWASPAKVATGIVRAIDGRKDVAFVPGFWRGIMWVVRMIPERVFKRLSL